MKKIISIGEVVWDMLPAGKQLGGAPVNFAYYAAALGAEACPITAIGKDALGDETLAALKETGLDLRAVQRNDLPTSRVNITLDEAGIPQYEIVENVAWDSLEATAEDIVLMRGADAVCWGSLSQRSEKSRKSILTLLDAAPQDCVKVFDINIRQNYYDREGITESLRRCNILKLNEDELPLLQKMFSLSSDFQQAIKALCLEYGISLVIFTQGARCSEIYDTDGLLSHIDTPKVKVVDTVGAGDSFTATFVSGLLGGAAVADAHRRAVEVSARVCTYSGAIRRISPEEAPTSITKLQTESTAQSCFERL